MEDHKSLQKLLESIKKTQITTSRQSIQLEEECDSLITINIGGTIFTTLTSTTRSVPGSLLSELDKNSKYFNQSLQAYYFDRDACIFKYILNAYRNGELHVPKDVCSTEFKKEMQFWQIPYRMLAPCCWKTFYETENDLDTLDELALNIRFPVAKVDTSEQKMEKTAVKENGTVNSATTEGDVVTHESKLWLFLEEPTSSTAAKVWCFIYMIVVLLSTFVYLIWMLPSMRVDKYLSESANFTPQAGVNEKKILIVATDPHPALFALDTFCMAFFIIELVFHFLACPRKREYHKNIHNVLKTILVIAMVISFVFEIRKDLFMVNRNYGKAYFGIKSVNVLRLLLICKLRKLYTGLHMLLLSLEKSSKEMLLLVVTFCLAVTVYGSLNFVCEIQSEMFPNVWTSMWWALITMTTVGYGDFYPTTTPGYLAGAICAINGLIVLALPIAAIASNFSGYYSRGADIEKHLKSIKKFDNLDLPYNKGKKEISSLTQDKEFYHFKKPNVQFQ